MNAQLHNCTHPSPPFRGEGVCVQVLCGFVRGFVRGFVQRGSCVR